MSYIIDNSRNEKLVPIFAYWDGIDKSILYGLETAWKEYFPQFYIFDDSEVVPILSEYFPEYIKTHKAIRTPAAKSDVAR